MLVDLSENLLANGISLGLDIYALAVTIFLAAMCIRVLGRSQASRYLRSTIILTAACLAADALAWAFDGAASSGSMSVMWGSTSFYFVVQVLMVVFWARYVHFRAVGRNLSLRSFLLLCVVPFVLIVALVVSNPFTGWLFTIEDGSYKRGALNGVVAFLVGAYVFVISAWLVSRRSHEQAYERSMELLLLGCSAIPALVAAVCQFLVYGLALIWPAVAFTVLGICINRAQYAISLDALTGLNNRGTLDRYLVSHVFDDPHKSCVLLLFDIDKFKAINDSRGHAAGDRALQRFAEGMRRCFDERGVFLSRYGGDEFVAVFPNETPEQLMPRIARFEAMLLEKGGVAALDIPLTVSIGMATMPDERVKGPADLIRLADESMYADKRS
jgi:diguanylate cyclase (GGDEF)-like protein